jgi:dienelactone hydrolase
VKLIYVAGPYTGKTINEVFENIMEARRAAYRLWNQGYAVICPHLNSAFMDGHDIEATRQMFIQGDLAILKRCDAIYMLSNWRLSPGATEELAKAKEWGLEVIYE